MYFGPLGILTPKLVSVKEQPMPRITSAWSRKWRTGSGMAKPPLPRLSGWSSGKEDLPPRLVVTGMASNSASALSWGQARAQWMPVPA
jgi:hypothetical protein